MTKLSVSPALSKRSLASHSWLGLLVGVLMYLVCLTGTLAVFAQEIMRWEQPGIHESLEYDAETIQTGYENLLREHTELTSHNIVIRLPTIDLPRASISTEGQSWYLDADGNLSESKEQPFTDFLANLHASLHLPHELGEVIVSLLGVLLCALIISGLFAHRRILKDAFSFRNKKSVQKREADLHNRLSVWGLPFHLMIALTGAYFGLAGPLNSLYADALYEGDDMAVFADLYGGIPQVKEHGEALNIPRAMTGLNTIAPDTQPIFITVEQADTDDQFMLIGSQHMDKLIYSEQYRFDASGSYIDKVGYADGEPGQGAVFSVYRTHFGHFGGEFMKIVYFALGLALTVIAVSGINLWLHKRTKRDALNSLWVGIVWGTPAAIVLAALAQIGLGIAAVPTFWLGLIAAMTFAQLRCRSEADTRKASSGLIYLTVIGLIALVVLHSLIFPFATTTAITLTVNAGLLLTALVLTLYARKLSARIAT